MANYKSIHGTTIKSYTTDPDNPIEGQVWYDKTNEVLQYQIPNVTAAWRTGNSLNTARSHLYGSGIQTAALAFGGITATGNPGSTYGTGVTESYDGTSWTEVNDLNQVRYDLSGFGTYTSTLAFGGYNPNLSPGTLDQTESWNGSNWTEVNDLNQESGSMAGIGADNTSGIAVRGSYNELWNGSSWTEVADLNTGRDQLGGAGIATAGLVFGGNISPVTGATESWNGSAWTELNDLNTARRQLGGSGTQTSALTFGGNIPPVTDKTESWNGSSWTEVADLPSARFMVGSSGASNTSSLAFGGNNATSPGPTAKIALTEEWNGATPVGAWATDASLNTARAYMGGAGTLTGGLAFGGYTPSPSDTGATESYNGTSFSELNDLNTTRGYLAGCGASNTSALAFGGFDPSVPGVTAKTESWNGSNWTEVGDLNTARNQFGGAGIITAALAFGGQIGPPNTAATESWNGSAWTEVNDMSTTRRYAFGSGIYTSALATGGNIAPNSVTGKTESWNGTSWTEVNDLNTAREQVASSGTTNSLALAFGGYPLTGKTEDWNGAAWVEIADLNTAAQATGSFSNVSSATGAISMGGFAPGIVATTEKFSSSTNLTKTVDQD